MLPSLFISHGSPMMALQPGRAGAALGAFARSISPPEAVLIVSPHWTSDTLKIGARKRLEAWHDFGGFPPALYALRYDAPGAPLWAERVRACLAEHAVEATLDAQRPLDHGAWVPMRLMWPEASVPVFQLSLLPDASPEALFAIGRALTELRAHHLLVIGSGSFTHNLHDFSPQAAFDEPVAPYVEEFREWMIDRIVAGDRNALFDWRKRAPQALRAQPTDEHLLPLFVALGAAADEACEVTRLTDEVTYGMLAMDAFAFGAAPPAPSVTRRA